MNDETRVLVLARAKVDRRWIQGAATDRQGGVCLGQALSSAAHEAFAQGETYSLRDMEGLVIRAIRQSEWAWSGSIPHWNDQPLRTKQQVLDVLDAAIRLADPADPVQTPAPVVEPPKSVIQKVKELVGV